MAQKIEIKSIEDFERVIQELWYRMDVMYNMLQELKYMYPTPVHIPSNPPPWIASPGKVNVKYGAGTSIGNYEEQDK